MTVSTPKPLVKNQATMTLSVGKEGKTMREIKFRAWVTNRDGVTYSNGDHMEYDVTIQDGKYADVESGWDIHGTYDCPLMQYTGLKDKNGKEIYEGDILFDGIGMRLPITVEEYHGYRFMWGKDQLYKGLATDGEIIGNIYENPNLLESTREK